ncbi:uncharacterized protein TNCV_3231461 [Trichonephila clavipes]|nr:uncharacterized protein TNCV_3231461 [Trichonephila clavipes]
MMEDRYHSGNLNTLPKENIPIRYQMRSPLRCYGCGKQGVIKSRCPTCNLNASQRTDVATNHINAYTPQTRSPRLTLIDITFCGIKGTCMCRHRIFTFNCWGKDVPDI